MDKKPTWMEEKVKHLGDRLDRTRAATPTSQALPMVSPLPPIRSGTWVSGSRSGNNPWMFVDPAIKQMSPYKRGGRAKYFHSGFQQRNPRSASVEPFPLPDIIIKSLSSTRASTATKEPRKIKKVTIVDEPHEIVLEKCSETEDIDTQALISARELIPNRELTPVSEFKSTPPQLLRTAAQVHDITNKSNEAEINVPESVDIQDFNSPMKVFECPIPRMDEVETTTIVVETNAQENRKAATIAKIAHKPVTEKIDEFRKQEEILFQGINEALVVQKVDPMPPQTEDQASKLIRESSEESIIFTLENDLIEMKTETTEKQEEQKAEIENENDYDEEYDDEKITTDENERYKQEAEARIRELSEYSSVLRGESVESIQPGSRVVRIFLSSTFSDTKGERNYLARLAYPRLQEWCQTLGLEFQVVDMRWGVTHDAMLDHATTDICLQQISECQRLSRGTNFVAFLGNRYGYQAPSITIEENEMRILQEIAKTNSLPNERLLSSWYQLDENAKPPKYVLLKISTVIKDFETQTQESEKRNQSLETWHQICSQLLQCLREATQIAIAEAKLPPESLYKHQKSVTELEIDKGILNHPNPKALFFTRTLEGLDESLSDPIAHKFIDLDIGLNEKRNVNNFSKNRIEEVHKNISERIAQENIFTYNLPWASLGLNAQEYKEVDEYLTRFCDDFVNGIINMTHRELEQGRVPALVEEIAFHTRFIGKRCSTFCGRKDVLNTIKRRLQELDTPSSPVVIYGRSGCGKTSVLSMVARHAREWLEKDIVVVVRFLGTTPMSTKVLPMLQSVCTQLCSIYGLALKEHFEYPMDLFQHFQEILENISQNKKEPLLLIFDSLDQLSSVDGAHFLTWLPKALPSFVKIVTSTLEFDFSILHTLKKSMPSDATYLNVEHLTDATVDEFVEIYLERNGRTLTEVQKLEFSKVFSENTHPIYIRLLMDQARQMPSFDVVDALALPLTAEMAMATLFDSLEHRFGRVFVSHAFTFLTICDGGMSEREIDDALSLDDLVLNEVYEFHDPPVQGSIRVPPLLWARLAFEVDQYLTERDVDGVTTVTWYHMLFQKFSFARYSNKAKYGNTKEHCFECLKELFTHEGQVRKTIVLSKRNKTIEDADRRVVHYPLSPSGKRKLMLLPYLLHNCKGSDMTRMIFCNLQWLITKLKGTTYSQLKQDFNYANPRNKEARIVLDTLHMGSSVFQENPDLVAFELVARLPRDHFADMPNVSSLIQQCTEFLENHAATHLIPTVPCLPAPNGLLKTTIHGPTDLLEVYGDSFALTRGTLTGFQVWNIESLELQHYLCDGYKVESNITYQDAESKLAVQTYQTTMNLWDIESGAIVKSMNVFPDCKNTAETPLKWAIEVFALSKSKHLCIVKIIAGFLMKDNTKRLLLCDLNTGSVSPIRMGTEKEEIQAVKREIIVCAQFINNDQEILVWCNTNPACVVFIDTHTLQTIEVVNVDQIGKSVPLKFHHDHYYFHPTKPYLIIKCRAVNFVVVDLQHRCFRNALSETNADGKIADICWYGDGVVLATFSPRSKIAMLLTYDAKYQKTKKQFLMKNGHPRVIRMVPDSDVLAIGYTFIGVIQFWKLDSMTCVFTLKGHSASINMIIFSENSRTMFSSSENKAMKVWNIGNALESHLPAEPCVESDDELTSQSDSELSIFKTLRQYESFTTNVEQMLLLKGGKQFVSAYADKPPVIWNLEKPEERQQLEPAGGSDGTLVVAESPEGFFVYGLTQRKVNDLYYSSVNKWNITTCKLLATSETVEMTEENMCGLTVFPKTGKVAVLKRMKTETELLVLEPATLQVVRIHRIQRAVIDSNIRISADESVAVTVNPRNVIVVWLLNERKPDDDSAEDGVIFQSEEQTSKETMPDSLTDNNLPEIINTPILNLPLRAQVNSVVLVDDHSIIAGLHSGSIEAVTLDTDTELDLDYHDRLSNKESRHVGEVWGVKLFPDNRRIFTVSNDKAYKILDIVDKKVVFTKHLAHNGRIRCCDVSPDSKLAVTGGRDKAIRLWAVKDGTAICSVNMYEDIYEIMFGLDGRMVIALIHKFGERRLAIFNIFGNLNNL